MRLYSTRAGYLHHVQSDYDCFVPNRISSIKIDYDLELISLLDSANKKIGILDGILAYLPNRDVFLSMYVQKEALLSSQIEGTQASLSDVLQQNIVSNEKRKDTEEIVNYVKALNKGIELRKQLPFSIRYIKELHKTLLAGVRGEKKDPGELRRSQNWIGPQGCNLHNASFVPPTPDKMLTALYELEEDVNSKVFINPPLVEAALIHYQFETIHPFLDGNGRLGRLIIPLFLLDREVFSAPSIYLSLYFKQNRSDYYQLLSDVRFKGNYESWIKFFLKGICEISDNSIRSIEDMKKLGEEISDKINIMDYKNKELLYKALELLYAHPYFLSKDLVKGLNITRPTASVIIKKLLDIDVIHSINNKQRNTLYRFSKYVEILEEGTNI
jgi:Fic family protein